MFPLVPSLFLRLGNGAIRCLRGCSRCSLCSHANCRGFEKASKAPGIMHRLMGEFDRRLPRPRRSPLGCDGLMVCSPRLGDLLFVSLMGSYIWHHAALDQFRALYGVAMERGGVRRALSRIVRIRNSGRMAWSPNQLRRAKPALESEKEVGSSEFGADFAHFPNRHEFGIQGV
jgi:hypothetical protein